MTLEDLMDDLGARYNGNAEDLKFRVEFTDSEGNALTPREIRFDYSDQRITFELE